MGTPTERRSTVAHAPDKGEKQAKQTAQKSIKEQRAAKTAKQSPTRSE